MRYRYGDVLWAEVEDHNGYRKSRPLIILNANDEIKASLPLVCAAVSTRFKLPLPRTQTALPWAEHGLRAESGLWQACVAVLDWVHELPHGAVKRVLGHLPAATLDEIQRRIEELEASDD